MRATAGCDGLTRASLASRRLLTLKRGSWRRPDVLLVESGGRRLVVKDYRRCTPLVRRSLGRWSMDREMRAYGVLRGHPAVPLCLGRIDDLALVFEYRPGPRFSRRRPWTFSPDFADALERAVTELHGRGVVHLDLRHRSNLRADTEGRPVLVDFTSAIAFPSGSLGRRWLLPLLARIDRHAVGKWRRRIARGVQDGERLSSLGTMSEGSRSASLPT